MALFVVFMSDGAPSDHNDAACKHGVHVWRHDPRGGIHGKSGKPKLQQCPTTGACRAAAHAAVRSGCIHRVAQLGARFGKDRVCLHAVAFGSAKEDYRVLQEMASR